MCARVSACASMHMARACVRACVRVRVCLCVHMCVCGIQPNWVSGCGLGRDIP